MAMVRTQCGGLSKLPVEHRAILAYIGLTEAEQRVCISMCDDIMALATVTSKRNNTTQCNTKQNSADQYNDHY